MTGLCWANILDCAGKNHDIPRSSLSNAVLVLQHDPMFGPSSLYYDEFLDCVITRDGEALRPWRDDDDTRLTVYMQQIIGMLTVAESIVASAVRYVARQRARHCVREWLRTLIWDGVPRIDHAFEDFWGAEPGSSQSLEYLRAASGNFFIGAIARVECPGCQLDTMPVFEGSQGVRKSSMLRALGMPWYMAATESVNSKDFQQSFRGAWFNEIPELDSFSRADRDRVKSIISTPVDKYRPSYGRYARDFPRQCVFAGTTNKDDWGNDDTGLRRFWPVRCGELNVPGLIAIKPQLFAEAFTRFSAGEHWWDMPEVSTLAAQRERQYEDPWSATVLIWLEMKDEITSTDILVNSPLRFRESDIGRLEQTRIASILALNGWRRQTIRVAGKPLKGFRRVS